VTAYETSVLGSVGDRAVKEREVIGKVLGLGFPARRDIIFGRSSKGNRLRTMQNIQLAKKVQMVVVYTWTRTTFLDNGEHGGRWKVSRMSSMYHHKRTLPWRVLTENAHNIHRDKTLGVVLQHLHPRGVSMRDEPDKT
jgi:hypothetical protein